MLCDDPQKAFLQIQIKEEDCDVLRFHWVWGEYPNEIKILRFTRFVFGIVQPPFILEGRNNEHLSSRKEKYPAEVAEIKDYLYVNDLITCGKNFEKVASLKDIVI